MTAIGAAALPLNAASVGNDPARIDKVARDLEGVFAQMMIKQMRATAGGDAMFPGDAAHFREMYDAKLAEQLTRGPGLGLSAMIARQLQQQGATPSAPTGPLPLNPERGPMPIGSTRAALPLDARAQAPLRPLNPYTTATLPMSTGSSAPRAGWLPTAPVAAPTVADARPAEAAQARADAAFESLAADFRPGSPEAFVAKVWPHAQRVANELGVNPRAIVAQAALETGWGRSTIRARGDDAHNYFGIKAGGRWQGERAEVGTMEYVNGAMRRERASFRAYDSPAQSFDDYANLLQNSPRYASALRAGDNPQAFGAALQRAGYATDPNYARKLAAIANGPTLDRALERLGVNGSQGAAPTTGGLMAATVPGI